MEKASIADLLNQPTVQMVECRECHKRVPEGTKECPYCGKAPSLPTMKEFGRKLPIGIIEGKGDDLHLNREFSVVNDIDYNLEIEINRIWQNLRNRRQSTGEIDQLGVCDHVTGVLAHTVTNLGGKIFSKLEEDRRIMVLQEMFIGDVFYMYAFLRNVVMGPEIKIEDMVCPSCRRKFSPVVDLSSIEVSAVDDVKKLHKDIELIKGFEMMGELRTKITIKPGIMRSLLFSEGVGGTRAFGDTLRHSVVKVEGVPDGHLLTEIELAKLSRVDIDHIGKEMDFLTGGPNWSIEIRCSCGHDIKYVINWMYADFFVRSCQFNQFGISSRR